MAASHAAGMTDPLRGVLAMVAAASVWGLSGIYYKALDAVPPLEVLAHRTLWSVVFFGTVLLAQGRAREARRALVGARTVAVLACSAGLIALNWLCFIFAIQSDRALEASLGYYIFPLVAVALGFAVLGERFTPLQTVSILLAAAAVCVLTIGLGHPPWLSLLIAASFGLYGLLKTRLELGPVVSVFVETLLLAPLALVWLLHLGAGGAFGGDWATTLLLIGSGPLTATPLILFSYATRRISYSSVGLLQYLNPTLQFAVALALFDERFTVWHAVAFPLIWIGLLTFSVENRRRARRPAGLAVPDAARLAAQHSARLPADR